MAATQIGRALTEQHRKAQLQLRAKALQDYTRLWPVWEGDEDSFIKLVLASIVLVKGYQLISSQTAGNYFQSFRIAEGAKGDALTRLADPVDESKVRAALFATGQVAVKQALAAGQSPERAKQVALTRTSGAVSTQVLNGGRETLLASVQDDKSALGWSRVTDSDPCAFCALLAGRGPVYKSEQTADFQAHGNCVPAGTLVSGPLPELGFRRRYQGELIVIRLASGSELSITPNHPVLTGRGWVEAGLLHEGDDVVERSGADLDALGVPHKDHVPSPIEDVWSTAGMVGLRSVPVAAEDFHGDGVGSEGDIEVKAAHRFLAGVQDVENGEFSAEPVRAGTSEATEAGALARQGELAKMLFSPRCPTHGSVGSSREFMPTLGAERRGVEPTRIARAATLDSRTQEPASHHGSADTMAFRQGLLRTSRKVGLDNSLGHGNPVRARASLPGTRFDPPPLESEADLLRAKAHLGASLLERLAAGVKLSRLVELRRIGSWSGHVYNLQTVEGWYDANGIVVSNCGCSVEPTYDRTSPWPGRAREYHDLYNEAIHEANEADELDRGTSNDLLNAFRRKYEAQQHAA